MSRHAEVTKRSSLAIAIVVWVGAGWLPAAAAVGDPDLVIHVGDYNYRGTPNKTQAGEWSYDGCVPTDWGPLVHQSSFDTWETWNDDFFTPMAPLLAAAPWVVVRGNHELCSRSGRGWFYLLDPLSPLLDPYDAQPSCEAPAVLTAPYRLRFENLDLVVLDTAGQPQTAPLARCAQPLQNGRLCAAGQ